MEISDKEFELKKEYLQHTKDILNFICKNKGKAYSLRSLLKILCPNDLPKYSNEDDFITLLNKGSKEIPLVFQFKQALEKLVEDDMIESQPDVRTKEGLKETYYRCKKNH